MRNLFSILFFFFLLIGHSQELNCNVVVDAQQTGNANFPIFKTLENELNEFINNTKWTKKKYKNQERINCNMVINVSSYSGESFNASLQIQSSRPVYGSSFSTPIYNFNDKDFSFNYLEYQNLIYNPNQFESDLISVLAFHIHMMLALDADTFKENGGDMHYNQAKTIANYSQQSNAKGWKQEDGLQSRFALINNVLSTQYKEFRSVMYNYHRKGLDLMSEDAEYGKEEIANALLPLKEMNNRRPNSFLLRIFFDAKADEIEQIFSDGPSVDIVPLKETLQSIAPMHSGKWKKIKY